MRVLSAPTVVCAQDLSEYTPSKTFASYNSLYVYRKVHNQRSHTSKADGSGEIALTMYATSDTLL